MVTGYPNNNPVLSECRPQFYNNRIQYVVIIPVIAFMPGIYSYTPETNRVSRVYSVAAVLYLQSVLHVMLFSQ